MNRPDLVQRALRLLMQPPKRVQPEEAMRQQHGVDHDHASKYSTVHPGDRITWTRADGTTHTGLVDALYTDTDGHAWLYVLTGETWTVLNPMMATVVMDAVTHNPPMSQDLFPEWSEGR